MFDSLPTEDAAARLRAAAGPPFAALLVALLYLAVYPLFDRVPAALFWSIVAIELAGALGGLVAITRVIRSERIRARAFGWLAAALALTLVCTWFFVSLTFPWL